MRISEIPVENVDVSEFNARKNLLDGQDDSSIDDLASSIERQGLLSPITVYQRKDGRYSLIVGQRRLLAFKKLRKATIPAIVRDFMTQSDATAVSLVENIHRADMNPRDKAIAFKALLDRYEGSYERVSRETGVGVQTIRKYIQLLELAPELQSKLAAGEAKSTTALARLAQKFDDPAKQLEVYDRIGGFTEDVQTSILRGVDPSLSNLESLVDQAHEGVFDVKIVRNCLYDCTNIPGPLKPQVAKRIEDFKSARSRR